MCAVYEIGFMNDVMERAGPVLAAAHIIDLATCICACDIVLYNLMYTDHLRVKLQLLSDL